MMPSAKKKTKTVVTLKPHGNRFGDSYDKAIGDVYEHGNPKTDLTLGNVKLENDAKNKRSSKGRS